MVVCCMSLRQKRSSSVEAFVSRMMVDKYIYLSKAGTSTVEVWDKKSEKLVDCIDCAHIIRYALPKHSHTVFRPGLLDLHWLPFTI